MHNRTGDDSSSSEDDSKQELESFFAAAKHAADQQNSFGREAPAAMARLAKAIYGRDNSQAVTVGMALASIYNGSEARPVRLDELRWLDWSLQRDLIVVMLGTGHAGFEDYHMRDAFRTLGGDAAVDWFHWWTTGGAHRHALRSLVEFIVKDRHCSSARTLRDAFRSIVQGGAKADLSRLNYMDNELSVPFVMVLDALFGRDHGALKIEDVQEAFAAANAADFLTSEAVPEKTQNNSAA